MVADTVLFGAVEIVIARLAEFYSALNESRADGVVFGSIGNAEQPASAVVFARATRLVLRALEVGEYVGRGSSRVAELAPQIEVLMLTANIRPCR